MLMYFVVDILMYEVEDNYILWFLLGKSKFIRLVNVKFYEGILKRYF